MGLMNQGFQGTITLTIEKKGENVFLWNLKMLANLRLRRRWGKGGGMDQDIDT